MNFPLECYVTDTGQVIGASETDQAYTRVPCDQRTVDGRPVAYAGRWYGSQMRYKPFRFAVDAARERLR